MDCGSFAKDIVEVVEANSKYIYIRAQRCEDFKQHIREVLKEDWQEVKIGYKCHIA